MSNCQYCNRTFASESSLYSHQKRAKYCLKIQEQKKVIEFTPSFMCQGCEKKFVTKREFNNHENRCYDLLKKNVEARDKEILKLKAIINTHNKEINELKLQHVKEIMQIYRSMNERKEACIEEMAYNKLTALANKEEER